MSMLSTASSRTARAEIKFNVQTEFPHLGLHLAAATGDFGLVKYALEHGQPVNSVLDGVLPLHAASSGGSDMVVKLLIDNGADVNAARLPRKYSTSASSSHPVIGSSGATPLHFAAANGHISVLRTLLQHGAHADHKDKHGITPAAVARENGHEDCARMLTEWESGERDRDLLERDHQHLFGGYVLDDRSGEVQRETSDQDPARLRTDSLASSGRNHSVERSKLRVKRSIDTALHSLASLKSFPSSTLLQTTSQCPPSPAPAAHADLSSHSGDRWGSTPHVHRTPSTRSGSKHMTSSGRRPQSAGTGADPPTPRKLGSKYSLLNMFKRNTSDELGAPISPNASPRYTTSPLPSMSPLSLRHNIPSDGEEGPVDEKKAARSGSKSPSPRNIEDRAPSPLSRPSILRPRPHHNASSSTSTSGVGTPPFAPRMLRFDSEAPESLTSYATSSNHPNESSEYIKAFSDSSDEDEDEEYGTVIPSNDHVILGQRAFSHTSSPPLELHSLPPISTPPLEDTEVPITIEPAPPDPHSESSPEISRDMTDVDRARGNSVSSIDPDAPPQMSWGSTTTSDTSGVNTPPRPTTALLPNPAKVSVQSPNPEGLLLAPVLPTGSRTRTRTSSSNSNIRPADIDIKGISTHAQAEKRVQEAQQSLLNRSSGQDSSGLEVPSQYASVGSGKSSDSNAIAWSPLSAKLAAYGESLRQLKRVEEAGSAVDDGEDGLIDTLTRDAERRAALLREIEKKRRPSSPSTPPTAYFTRERGGAGSPSSTLSSGRKRQGSAGAADTAPLRFDPSRSPGVVREETGPTTSAGFGANSSNCPKSDSPRRHQTSNSISSVHTRARAHSLRPEIRVSDPQSTVPSPSTPSILNIPSSAPIECSLQLDTPISASTSSDIDSGTPELPVKVPQAVRQLTSASKLTRMGFSGSPVTSNSAISGSPSRTTTKSRFGFGSIIHTLTGKS